MNYAKAKRSGAADAARISACSRRFAPLASKVHTLSARVLDAAAGLLPGTISEQLIQCGKRNCWCREGHLHGPYSFRVWREGSKVKKVYVKLSDVEGVRLRCERHCSLVGDIRALRNEIKALTGQMRKQTRASQRPPKFL